MDHDEFERRDREKDAIWLFSVIVTLGFFALIFILGIGYVLFYLFT